MKEANHFYRASQFQFSSSVSVPIQNKGWGVWAEYALQIESAHNENSNDLMRVNAIGPKLDLDNYYLSNNYMDVDNGVNFLFRGGAYRRFAFERWTIDARLGFGYLIMASALNYNFTVKEKDTNHIYNVELTDSRNGTDYHSLFLSGGIKVNYYLGRKQRFFLGASLSYIQNLQRAKLYYERIETISNETVKKRTIKGRASSSFDFSLRAGFSF